MPPRRSVEPRREPEQQRSRAGVDAILQATADLLNVTGVDQLTITAIAHHAGLSKAAVYRYYPSKAAVLRALAQQTFEHEAARITAMLDPDADPRELIDRGLREYLDRHRSEPFRVQLRAAVRADPELSRLDLEDSRANAMTIAAFLSESPADPDLQRRVLLVIETLDSVVRLISMVDPDEADQLIDSFIEMATGYLFPD